MIFDQAKLGRCPGQENYMKSVRKEDEEVVLVQYDVRRWVRVGITCV